MKSLLSVILLASALSLTGFARVTHDFTHPSEVKQVTPKVCANADLNFTISNHFEFGDSVIICNVNHTVYSAQPLAPVAFVEAVKIQCGPTPYKWLANSKWRIRHQNNSLSFYSKSATNYTYLSQIKQCTSVG